MQSVNDISVESAGVASVLWLEELMHDVSDNDAIPRPMPTITAFPNNRFLAISRSRYISSLSHAGHVPAQSSTWLQSQEVYSISFARAMSSLICLSVSQIFFPFLILFVFRFSSSPFGDIGLIAFAVDVVLASSGTGLNCTTTTIIVSTRRIISCPFPFGANIKIPVTTS